MLRDTLVAMGTSVTLLDRSTSPSNLLRWYKADTNNVPAQSILQPITSILPNFLNKKEPSLQAEAAASWWVVQSSIQVTVWLHLAQGMLRKAARALQHSGEFTAEQAHNYHMSVTEREVGRAARMAGIIFPRLSEGA